MTPPPDGAARVDLSLLDSQGNRVWGLSTVSAPNGEFAFTAGQLPEQVLVPGRHGATLRVSATGFFPDTAQLIAVVDSGHAVRFTPTGVSISLVAFSRWSAFVLFLPAMGGILGALLLLMVPPGDKHYVWVRVAYSALIAGLWILVVGQLVWIFARTGQDAIPLLSPRLAVPSVLIVAAFLGAMTYVAYSIYTRSPEFFAPAKNQDRRKLLQVAAGRVLVAPYVALIGYSVLSQSFPDLGNPKFAIFFGFFAGLWIKVVLEALNDIGLRFLSQESRAKVAAKLAGTAPTQGAEGAPKALLEIVGKKLEYDVGGVRVTHPVDRSRLALRFVKGAETRQQEVAGRLGLSPVDGPADSDILYSLWMVPDTSLDAYREVVRTAKKHPDVAQVAPVFGGGDGRWAFPTGEVVFQLGSGQGALPNDVNKVLAANPGTLEEADTTRGKYVVSTGEATDPFDLAARLDELSEVAFAEADLAQTVESHGTYAVQARCPNAWDAFTDIGVQAAWQRRDALVDAPEVRIAIIDDGVDLQHDDLAPTLAGHFDAYEDTGLPCPQGFDSHGTACAGLAVASPQGDGMAGVGKGCRLLAARALYRARSDLPPFPSGKRLAAAIDWAVANGADVISLSWSYPMKSATLEAALSDAVTRGRQGRGCIILAAAGNEGNSVDYPATLPYVIAVGAVGNDGRLAQGPGWASDRGPELEILAPGVDLFTADIGGYRCDFGGTSAAAPIVAGAVALLLQANPTLRRADVLRLLQETGTPAAPGQGQLPPVVNVDAALQAASSWAPGRFPLMAEDP